MLIKQKLKKICKIIKIYNEIFVRINAWLTGEGDTNPIEGYNLKIIFIILKKYK